MNTKQLRQKILDLAIRGKLVPQDPNDEPAKIKSTFKTHSPYDVPISWIWAKICGVCEPQETKRPTGDTFRYIDIESIDNKRHCVSEPKTIATAKAPSRAAKGVISGDTLFSMVRPYLENIAFIPDELDDCIASTGFYICRPRQNILFSSYLFIVLTSRYAIDGINSYMRGDNSPAIRKNEMDGFTIPIPPLAEQRRIVATIESAFAVIDEIERNKADLQTAVAAAKQKILSLAIQGKLVPQDVRDEPAGGLLERILAKREASIKSGKVKKDKKISAAINFDDEIDFSELPNNWKICLLGELASYKKGPFGSSITKSMFIPDSDTAIKVYEQKNSIQKDASLGTYYISQDKFDELKGFEVFEGDIIVSCAGTIGETYVMPRGLRKGIINQALMKVSLYEKGITDFYLIYFDYALKELAQKESKGTAIKNIPPFEVLKQFPFPLPPLAEQKRIVAAVEAAFEQLDGVVGNLK